MRKTVALNELVTLQRGFDLPKSDRKNGSFPVIASTSIGGYHDSFKVKGPGVVIGRSGSIGGGQFIEQDFWPLNTTLWVKDFKGHDERFIYYLMKSIDFSVFNVGSGVPTLNRNHLSSLNVRLFSQTEEIIISDILGALDDKIELNQKTNQTLEQIAQAIFKSWFVDFDPVIDNALEQGKLLPEALAKRAEQRKAVRAQQAKGELPSLPKDLRQRFPSDFVFSDELGWVPKGWEIGKLKDIASVKAGYAFKSKSFQDNGAAVLKIKNINSDRTVDTQDCRCIPDDLVSKYNEYVLRDGDIIMAMTGATVGKFGLLTLSDDRNYLLNQRVALLRELKSENSCSNFLYSYLLTNAIDEMVSNLAQGSAQPNASANDIENIKMVAPDRAVIDIYKTHTSAMFEKINSSRKESQTLSELRDTLLPKLISGELRIPDAEKLAADAGL